MLNRFRLPWRRSHGGHFGLGSAGRKRLMEMVRRHPHPAVRLRAHIMLLLEDGWSGSSVQSALYRSSRTIDRWEKRFEAGGLEALAADSLVTANWYLALTGLLAIPLLAIRTRTEEEKLIERFGDRYREYMGSTGRFFPRVSRSA